MLMYMILCGINAIFLGVTFGLLFSGKKFMKTSGSDIIIGFGVVMLIFYIIAITISYKFYGELKTIHAAYV